MQTLVLWSDQLHPSTSTTPERSTTAHNDVDSDQKPEETSSTSRSVSRSTRTQTGFFGPVLCALVCLLFLMANTCNAAPIHEQPAKGLQNSLIYSSLLRWVHRLHEILVPKLWNRQCFIVFGLFSISVECTLELCKNSASCPACSLSSSIFWTFRRRHPKYKHFLSV